MDELSNSKASSAEGVTVNDNKVIVSINQAGPVSAGSSVVITASKGVGQEEGTIALEEKIVNEGVESWVTVANPLVIESASVDLDNGREFRGYLTRPQGTNKAAQNNDFVSTSIKLKVQEDCAGFNLDPSMVSVKYLGNNNYEFTTDYVVTTCGRAVNGIKLQGGLTAGAVFVKDQTTSGVVPKTTGKGDKSNTVLTWNVGDMPAGATKTFTVVYSQKVACGTMKTITGAWSAKGTYPDDLTAAVAGYDNTQAYSAMSCSF
ncbi:hypothetical protein TH63_04980 [Rufibacter radiotolerans]|uniref:Uncharacterized protein n=2 Tax=Rufibacter radiotolerans TaxID=1379910 RepID=A0A0H4VMN7_9BACT|nr:hypothetical protein TH63_04980 [Rufibacter radiotolerans]